MFSYAVPGLNEQKTNFSIAATFSVSLFWLFVLCFLMLEWAQKMGCLLGIPSAVMGLTITAIGTSTPEALSSMFIAKAGKGDVAISNVFGSNIFDILFALGFPALIFNTSHISSDTSAENLVTVVILLALFVCFFASAFVKPSMVLTVRIGYLYIFLYTAYVVAVAVIGGVVSS